MASILQTQQEISKLVSLIPSKYYYFRHFEEDLIGQKKPNNAPSSHKRKALEAAAARQVSAASSASLEGNITDNTTKSISNANVQEIKEESLTIQPMKNSNAVDLKLKLQSRINELRNQRLGSDPKSKQELLEKRKSKQKLSKKASKNKDNSLDISKFTTSKSKQTVSDDGKDDMNTEMQFGSLDFGIQTKQKGPKDVHSLLKKAKLVNPRQKRNRKSWTNWIKIKRQRLLKRRRGPN